MRVPSNVSSDPSIFSILVLGSDRDQCETEQVCTGSDRTTLLQHQIDVAHDADLAFNKRKEAAGTESATIPGVLSQRGTYIGVRDPRTGLFCSWVRELDWAWNPGGDFVSPSGKSIYLWNLCEKKGFRNMLVHNSTSVWPNRPIFRKS